MTHDLIPIERFDLARMLQQGVLWRSYGDHARLVTYCIDDMGTGHRRRVLGWLRANAPMLRDFHADLITHQQKVGFLGRETWAEMLAELDATAPDAWLEEQTLVRRLVQLTPRDPLPARGLLARRWRRR